MLLRRIEALEGQMRPTATATIDLASLPDDDRQFIADISPRCETDGGKPDLSRLTVPELRRLHDIAEQYARVAA
jgi:hypothetical protein